MEHVRIPAKTTRWLSTVALSGLVIATGAAIAPAQAEVTEMDVLVAGRAIGFVDKFSHGELSVGIVVVPDSAQSIQEANELKAVLGSQFRVGNLVLKPVLLPASEVRGADVDLYFLTEGARAAAATVSEESKARKIPCVTFDLSQVRNGACAIGVQSRPRVEVFVNRKAALESHTTFSSIFRLMITEL